MIFSLFFSFCFTTLILIWWFLRGIIKAAILAYFGYRFTAGYEILFSTAWFLIALPIFLLIGGILAARAAKILPDSMKTKSPMVALMIFTVVLAMQIVIAVFVVHPAVALDER